MSTNFSTTKKKQSHGQKSQARKNRRFYSNHRKACEDAIRQIKQTPMGTLVTCMIIALTLLLTATLMLTLKSFQQITNYINSSNQITLYLKKDSSDYQINVLLDQLKQNPIVKEGSYLSPTAALKELAEQENYQDILKNVDENPLPPVIQLRLDIHDKAKLQALNEQLKKTPLVATFNLDYDWLARLTALINLGHRISYALALILGLGIILIVNHSIQTATQRNEQEMAILHLIGAPFTYIRRPFLYLGSLLGFGAGLITLLILTFLYWAIKTPLLELLQNYHLQNIELINLHLIFEVVFSSISLGFLGAWLAFFKYSRYL